MDVKTYAAVLIGFIIICSICYDSRSFDKANFRSEANFAELRDA